VFDAFEREVERIARGYENNRETKAKLLKLALFDDKRGTFPYFTILLMFKAGMSLQAMKYCEISQLKEVSDFGKHLISTYIQSNCILRRE